jgi:hypothetical protein
LHVRYGLAPFRARSRRPQLSKEVVVLDAGRLPLRARAWARSNAPSQSRMPFCLWVIIAVLQTSNGHGLGSGRPRCRSRGWATRLRRFCRWGTVSWSFCCLWLRSWLAPGGGLLASRRLDGRNQIACRGICWRRCSAAALAEFLDGFFAQPDDDADDSNPGDQGDYANGGIVGEEGEEVGEQHAGRAGLRRRLVNG